MQLGRNGDVVVQRGRQRTCAAATQVGITCELIAHGSGHGMADDTREARTPADDFLHREMGIETSVNPSRV